MVPFAPLTVPSDLCPTVRDECGGGGTADARHGFVPRVPFSALWFLFLSLWDWDRSSLSAC